MARADKQRNLKGNTPMKEKEQPDEEASKRVGFQKDWHDIKWVLFAGALGGLAAWGYGLVLGDPAPGGVWAVPAAIFLGAFAAGIGVFVLTNTDTSAFARTMFFAALCGFVWRPVLDAGKASLDQAIQQKQNKEAANLGDQVAELASNLTNTPPSQLPNKLEAINDAAVAAVDSLPEVNNVRVKREIESKVSAALRTVSQFAPQNPQVASKVIQSVGEAGAKNQSPKISNEAVTSLEKLSATNSAFASSHRQLK